MNVIRQSFLLLFFCLPGLVFGQKLKKQDKQLLENLQRHIHFLADDRLQGRRAGSAGERMAAEYISKEFAAIQLKPKGTEGYFQTFEINEGKEITPTSHNYLGNRKEFDLDKDVIIHY